MSTLHPLVVHFPIVLLFLWPLVEGAGLYWRRPDVSRVGLALLIGAAVSGIAAVVTGQAAFDAAVAAGVAGTLLNTHADAANLVPWAMFGLVFVRTVGVLKYGVKAQWIAVVLGFAMWPFIFSVGGSGGDLVYDHGVGVSVDARGAPR